MEFIWGKANSVGYRLVVLKGKQAGQSFMLDGKTAWTLGRSQQCDIRISDLGVSRRHCRIVFQAGEWIVLDLDSANGTYVNAKAVRRHMLNDGDHIVIGNVVIEFGSATIQTGDEPPRERRISSVYFVDDTVPAKGEGSSRIRRKLDANSMTHSLFVAPESESSLYAKRSAERLEAIFRLGNLVYQEKSVERIIQIATGSILDVTGADRCSILTVNDDGTYEPAAFRSKNPLEDREFPVSRTIVDEAVSSGISVLSSDAMSDARFREGHSVVIQQIRSVMCVPLMAEGERVLGAIYVDNNNPQTHFDEGDLNFMAAVGMQTGVAVERARLVQDLEELFVSAIHTLVTGIEAKDKYTRGHSERVTRYALMLADLMDVPREVRTVIEVSGLLHDVGKIGIPEAILNKPSSLTSEEMKIIEEHPNTGAQIIRTLKNIDRIVDLDETALAVRHHHECFEGGGYPDGIKGEEIPLSSRILAVADTFDAITSSRPYRDGRAPDIAARIIKDCSGTQFDPEVAKAFRTLYEQGDFENPQEVETLFNIELGLDREE